MIESSSECRDVRRLLTHGAGYRSQWDVGQWRAGALWLLGTVFLLRLIYAWRMELMPEEAYYWNYAQHLDIGYLDHPPMVGWLIAATSAALPSGEFAVRAAALGCGAIAGYFTYCLTRELFDEPSAWVALGLSQTLPFFFASGLLMTPDSPLLAAWVAALYFLQRALLHGQRQAWWGVGLCFGLGLLSKYTIGLLGLATFVFMLVDARSRAWLKRHDPYTSAAVALLMFCPVIAWNAHNEWASFAFQTSGRLAQRAEFALPKLVGAALVLLTPTGLAAILSLLLRKHPPKGEIPENGIDRMRVWRFVRITTLMPVAVFVLFSLRREVKLDWTGAPWIAALPALGYGIVYPSEGVRRWLRYAWLPTLLGVLLLYGAALYDLTLGIPGVGYGRHAELVPIGWRDLGRQAHMIAEQIGRRDGKEPLIVGMDRYAIASELAFYATNQQLSVSQTSSGHLFGQVGLMYERWFPATVQSGRDLLLVGWTRADLSQSTLGDYVERLDPIHQGLILRGDEVVRPFYYRLAHDYHLHRP